MTQSNYDKLNKTGLRQECRKRGINAEAGWTKQELVDALVAHDKEHGAPEDLGDLPPVTEAPDEGDAASFSPPTAPPPVVKPPPKPGEQPDIPPELMPQQPKRYRLMNDFKWAKNGLPVKLKAGKILRDTSYPIEEMKKNGAVLVPERTFEARKAATE
jgi:hypothetical protein